MKSKNARKFITEDKPRKKWESPSVPPISEQKRFPIDPPQIGGLRVRKLKTRRFPEPEIVRKKWESIVIFIFYFPKYRNQMKNYKDFHHRGGQILMKMLGNYQ